jgi:hypothetical protein
MRSRLKSKDAGRRKGGRRKGTTRMQCRTVTTTCPTEIGCAHMTLRLFRAFESSAPAIVQLSCAEGLCIMYPSSLTLPLVCDVVANRILYRDDCAEPLKRRNFTKRSRARPGGARVPSARMTEPSATCDDRQVHCKFMPIALDLHLCFCKC